ncbi:MAG TPA: DUF177 domain-containing protein [Candidatus Binataceae bacterium]|nr:DUF177 domain-containing protein [Candidatus Binataceae bacterium]
MKLRVDDISGEAKEIAFAEAEETINRTLEAGPVHEFRITGPVNVEMSYYRAGTELFFEGELTAMTAASCARCAEEFVTPSTRSFRYILVPRALMSSADERADDLEFAVYEGDEVDLTPLVQEQVLLALPTRPLCKEDCRGLCPQCGINLNEHHCECRTGQFDTRLAVLRHLKLSRN